MRSAKDLEEIEDDEMLPKGTVILHETDFDRVRSDDESPGSASRRSAQRRMTLEDCLSGLPIIKDQIGNHYEFGEVLGTGTFGLV